MCPKVPTAGTVREGYAGDGGPGALGAVKHTNNQLLIRSKPTAALIFTSPRLAAVGEGEREGG